MKKFTTFILVIIALSACKNKHHDYIIPINSYFIRSNVDYTFTGTSNIHPEFAYGMVFYNNDGTIIYPALWLGRDIITGENMKFILDFNAASMKAFHHKTPYITLYLNHSVYTRKNYTLKITLFDGLFTHQENTPREMISQIHRVIDVKKSNKLTAVPQLPADNNGTLYKIDISPFSKALTETGSFHIQFETIESSLPAYLTTNEYNELSEPGILEFASPAWLSWSGNNSTIQLDKHKNILSINNKAINKIYYSPKIIWLEQ